MSPSEGLEASHAAFEKAQKLEEELEATLLEARKSTNDAQRQLQLDRGGSIDDEMELDDIITTRSGDACAKPKGKKMQRVRATSAVHHIFDLKKSVNKTHYILLAAMGCMMVLLVGQFVITLVATEYAKEMESTDGVLVDKVTGHTLQTEPTFERHVPAPLQLDPEMYSASEIKEATGEMLGDTWLTSVKEISIRLGSESPGAAQYMNHEVTAVEKKACIGIYQDSPCCNGNGGNNFAYLLFTTANKVFYAEQSSVLKPISLKICTDETIINGELLEVPDERPQSENRKLLSHDEITYQLRVRNHGQGKDWHAECCIQQLTIDVEEGYEPFNEVCDQAFCTVGSCSPEYGNGGVCQGHEHVEGCSTGVYVGQGAADTRGSSCIRWEDYSGLSHVNLFQDSWKSIPYDNNDHDGFSVATGWGNPHLSSFRWLETKQNRVTGKMSMSSNMWRQSCQNAVFTNDHLSHTISGGHYLNLCSAASMQEDFWSNIHHDLEMQLGKRVDQFTEYHDSSAADRYNHKYSYAGWGGDLAKQCAFCFACREFIPADKDVEVLRGVFATVGSYEAGGKNRLLAEHDQWWSPGSTNQCYQHLMMINGGSDYEFASRYEEWTTTDHVLATDPSLMDPLMDAPTTMDMFYDTH